MRAAAALLGALLLGAVVSPVAAAEPPLAVIPGEVSLLVRDGHLLQARELQFSKSDGEPLRVQLLTSRAELATLVDLGVELPLSLLELLSLDRDLPVTLLIEATSRTLGAGGLHFERTEAEIYPALLDLTNYRVVSILQAGRLQ